MNNKEFIAELSQRLELTQKTAAYITGALLEDMTECWKAGDAIMIGNFGSFEIRKKMERVLINPSTRQRMLVPPKLTLSFKPSNILKDKVQ